MAHVNSHDEDKYRDRQLHNHLTYTPRRSNGPSITPEPLEKKAGRWVGDANGFEIWEEIMEENK